MTRLDPASSKFEDRFPELHRILKQAYVTPVNVTLCHRVSGAVVLYAPDHNFKHVERYPDCPDYTLYRLPDAPRFADWVNTIALQWRQWIGASRG